MSEDLHDEIEAIQSIYGDQVISKLDDRLFILSIPQSQDVQPNISLRLYFPSEYPQWSRPQVLGTESVGDNIKKGHGRHIVDAANTILEKVFTPGCVCLYDLLQELDSCYMDEPEAQEDHVQTDPKRTSIDSRKDPPVSQTKGECEEPKWVTSLPITEKKSTFLARACCVKDRIQAKACIAHLLDHDRAVARASHNITAYRIRSVSTGSLASDVTYQDCDDDGETAAGGGLLHLLQVMDVWDVLVVVSRWYGGTHLGKVLLGFRHSFDNY